MRWVVTPGAQALFLTDVEFDELAEVAYALPKGHPVRERFMHLKADGAKSIEFEGLLKTGKDVGWL